MSKAKTRLTTAYAKLIIDGSVHAITNVRTFANGEKLFFLDNGGMYSARDLEFNQQIPDSDLRISVAKLREVLENRIPPYSDPKYVVAEVDLIIEQVKKEI